ncbi:hypothetical protein MKK69_06555 [Methylobacterium sp. J-026]|nr:hypothetical protein [Methylobacterium sp. J-026]
MPLPGRDAGREAEGAGCGEDDFRGARKPPNLPAVSFTAELRRQGTTFANTLKAALTVNSLDHGVRPPVLLSARTSAARRNETYTGLSDLFVPQST